MPSKPLINEKLLEQFERQGKKVIYTTRGKKKVKAKVVDPIDELYEKNDISFQERGDVKKYSADYELSMQYKIAKVTLETRTPINSDYCFEDRRIQAAKRVDEVKFKVKMLTSRRKRKLKKKLAEILGINTLTMYERVLHYIIEMRLNPRKMETKIGGKSSDIEKRCIDIIKIISECYKKKIDS